MFLNSVSSENLIVFIQVMLQSHGDSELFQLGLYGILNGFNVARSIDKIVVMDTSQKLKLSVKQWKIERQNEKKKNIANEIGAKCQKFK